MQGGGTVILVTGGLASGKQAYAQSLGFQDSDFSTQLGGGHAVLADAQESVRAEDADPVVLASVIAETKDLVTCVDVGNGIVPLDAGERAWRERAGQLQQELARRADCVVRMVCGVPMVVKGTLPQVGGTVRVIMLRHGATPGNVRRAYIGATDEPLSEDGAAQVRACGACPQISKVFVSPMQRARQTAELWFPNAEQVQAPGLREIDFGAFEGRSAQDMEADAAYRTWVDGGCEDACPNGEGKNDLTERVAASMRHIVRQALLHGERDAIVVAHGGTIMAAMSAFVQASGQGEPRGYFDWHVGTCEGYAADASFDAAGNLRFSDPQHVSGLGILAVSTAQASVLQPGASFFQNRACPHFPCHEGVPEQDFNCMFCYCPLYALGPDCGGNFTYTERGRKNCKACAIPHIRDNGAQLVRDRYPQLAALAASAGNPEPVQGWFNDLFATD